MGTIVCATRSGEASRPLQNRAVQLALERQAGLVFVYVVAPDTRLDLDEQLVPAISHELFWFAEATLNIAKIRARQAGVHVETTVRRGAVEDEIENVIREYQAELLVIGGSQARAGQHFSEDGVENFARQMEANTGVPVEIVRLTPEPAA